MTLLELNATYGEELLIGNEVMVIISTGTAEVFGNVNLV